MNIITISREYGSGGHEIGEKVAKELNIPFIDKKAIVQVAKEKGISENIFQSIDERAASSLLYSLLLNSYAMSNPQKISEGITLNDRLFNIQSDLFRKYANKGACVIVGRCADYILRERKNLFKVFICANEDTRIQRIIEYYNIPKEKSFSAMQKNDKQRSAYYNFFTNNQWHNPSNYDLCLNTSSISIDKAVKIIIKMNEIINK